MCNMAAIQGTEVPNIVVKWSGKEYVIDNFSNSDTVQHLKAIIAKKTNVLPERQKLLGLKYKGKPPTDDVKIGMLSLKQGMKIMMMGTAEENLETIIKPPDEVKSLKIDEDEDIEEEEVAFENREEYLAKIERRVASYQIKVLNEPREGKRLLVLDVDYTLFDHRSVAETGVDLMRPYLHEFLTSAYEHYDIVIWSATGMKWIEAKMQELGVSSNHNYKIMFMLDSNAMITVDSPTYGVIETKPLGVIWGKYSQYSSRNSIIIDDLRRNFLMNPRNGLKIRPFRKAHINRNTDQELLMLSKYLKKIAFIDDFGILSHQDWEKFLAEES